MTYQPFTFHEHTADAELRAYGHTYEELFLHALVGTFSYMHPRWKMPLTTVSRELRVQGNEYETLLINFLSASLCAGAIHHEAYTQATFSEFSATHLVAVVTGHPIIGYDHGEIKAVTYHNLAITHNRGMLQAVITVDI